MNDRVHWQGRKVCKVDISPADKKHTGQFFFVLTLVIVQQLERREFHHDFVIVM